MSDIFKQALAAQRGGDLDLAAKYYGQVLHQDPAHNASLINLGVLLKGRGHYQAALALYQRAATMDAKNITLQANLGNIYLALGKPEQALSFHEVVVKAKPDMAEAYFNKALSLRALGKLDQALFCFERALALDEQYIEADWDRALTLLQNGDYQEGFTALECRWRLPGIAKPRFQKPSWTGTIQPGKVLLVYAEQSIADTIFYLRFAKVLQTRGMNIICQCQQELVPLLQQQGWIDEVYPFGDPLPEFDMHVALGSIPRLLGTTRATIPQDMPYLSPALPQPPSWLHSAKNHLQVGLCWSDTITLTDMLPLLGVSGVQFTNLTPLPDGQQAQQLFLNGFLQGGASHIGSFADIAQALYYLEVLITTDSAIAHLAASMARPVWLLLPPTNAVGADWRWSGQDTFTPWYPTMRLYRQQDGTNWQALIDEVLVELKTLAG
jgi:tetratricopeptide (TPR) repeat protein